MVFGDTAYLYIKFGGYSYKFVVLEEMVVGFYSKRFAVLMVMLQASNTMLVGSYEAICTKCSEVREQAAQERIETIKSLILAKLNLKSAPKIHLSPKAKPLIERITRLVESEARNDNVLSDPEESKTKSETLVFGEEVHRNGKSVVVFRLSPDLQSKEVVAAALKIQMSVFRNSHIPSTAIECKVKEVQDNGEVSYIPFSSFYILFVSFFFFTVFSISNATLRSLVFLHYVYNNLSVLSEFWLVYTVG